LGTFVSKRDETSESWASHVGSAAKDRMNKVKNEAPNVFEEKEGAAIGHLVRLREYEMSIQ
jgi:hypothetical protein